MNQQCEELKDSYTPYALGILSGQEREQLEKHLQQQCPNCTAGVRAAINDTLALALGAPQQEPPARVKEQLLRRVEATGPTAPEAPPWKWLALAAMLALVVIMSGGIRRITHLQDQLNIQRSANLALQRQINAQQQALDRQERVLVYLRQSDIVLIPLKATLKDVPYSASAVWGKGGLLLIVNNLPAPPPDKTYQLWAITNKPVSAGIFKTDERGEATVEVTSLPPRSTTKILAVTLEPEGGVPQPTSSPILAGQTPSVP